MMISSDKPREVDAQLGGDEGELGDDVAARGGIDRVGHRMTEAELRRDRHGVEPERSSGHGARPVRRLGGADPPVAEALEVADERPGVREEVVREQDRLRVLQVRASRHHRIGMRGGLRGERVEELHDEVGDALPVVEQVEPHEGRDLVVAAAARAELAAQLRTDGRDQFALEGEVHVLVFGERADHAVADAAVDHVDALEHPGELVRVEIPGRGEGPGVRTRALEVVGREHPVEVGRPAQFGEFGRRAVGEAPSPEARATRVRGVVGGGPVIGGACCHRFWSPRVVSSLEVAPGG